jgi:hypothetical protein
MRNVLVYDVREDKVGTVVSKSLTEVRTLKVRIYLDGVCSKQYAYRIALRP